MKKIIPLFMLGALSNLLLSQPDTKVDSIKSLIAHSENDSLKMEWYNDLRKLTVYQDFSEAMQYAEEYLSLANKLKLDHKIAIGHAYRGNLYVRLGDYEQAVKELVTAVKFFEAQKDSTRMGSVYNSIAAAYENSGKDSLTAIYFRKSYDIFSTLKDSRRTALALNNLSNIEFRKGNYLQSENLLTEAITLLENSGFPRLSTIVQTNLANTKLALEKYAEADEWYQKSIQQTIGVNNYAYAANLKGYGRSKLRQKEYAEALQNLTEAINVIQQHDFTSLKKDVLEDLPLAFEGTGDYPNALQYFKWYVAFKDTLMDEESTRMLNDALQKYEAEKKDQEIALLASQNELKDLKIAKNQSERLVMIIGLIGLAILAILVFKNARDKTKANTLLKEKNTIIAQALEDKNLLLREIHHRVKNNLQVISSLLRLQSRHIEDEAALEAITESRNRVRSMSILHQNLYQEDKLTKVEVKQYLDELIEGLFKSYNIKKDQITLVKNIQEIDLDVDTLIPLGLIVNELISNTLKHAFPDHTDGNLSITLKTENNRMKLEVQDNGVGIDPASFTNSKSFGNRLIHAFVKKLNGHLEILNNDGSTTTITFHDPQLAANPSATPKLQTSLAG